MARRSALNALTRVAPMVAAGADVLAHGYDDPDVQNILDTWGEELGLTKDEAEDKQTDVVQNVDKILDNWGNELGIQRPKNDWKSVHLAVQKLDKQAKKKTGPKLGAAVQPAGDCFRYATSKARSLGDGAVVVHGVVTNTNPQPGERPKYEHAWVEFRGRVYDWQTETQAHKPFVNRKAFYAEKKPEQTKNYTPEEAMVAGIKSGHHGPWHELKAASDRTKIKTIAEAVHAKMGRCDLECVAFSQALRDALVEAGLPAVRVYGHVVVDGNWRDGWGKGDVDWANEDDTVERDLDHNWVEVDGLVVDIGAEQFNPLVKGTKFPAVYIAPKAKAKRHVPEEVIKARVSAGFPIPFDAWKHIKKGECPLPTPLEGHEKLWKKVASRIKQDTNKGVKQLWPVIGGRRRYHHRPLSSWLLTNGRTLTITSDPLEAKIWNNLKNKRQPSLPRIFDVFSLKFTGESQPKLWAIVHERLTWPVDADWGLFVDTFFRWRAMQKDALQPAQVKDLEHFLRFLIDPETTDPKTVQRRRIEHVLPWKMTRERRDDVAFRRENVWKDKGLEQKIAWAKAALRFLRENKVKFRDFDPSNLAKTKKGGRTVVVNLAESRSRPKKVGRLGRVAGHREAMLTAAATLVIALQTNEEAFTRHILQGEVDGGVHTGQKAIETLMKVARYIERDAQGLAAEFMAQAPSPEAASVLLSLAIALERYAKKTAQKLIQQR